MRRPYILKFMLKFKCKLNRMRDLDKESHVEIVRIPTSCKTTRQHYCFLQLNILRLDDFNSLKMRKRIQRNAQIVLGYVCV